MAKNTASDRDTETGANVLSATCDTETGANVLSATCDTETGANVLSATCDSSSVDRAHFLTSNACYNIK